MQRAIKIRALHPDWTEARVQEAVTESYRPKTPETQARSLANLELRGKHKRRKKGGKVADQRGKGVEGPILSSQWKEMDIIEFAEGPCSVYLYPAQRAVLKAIYGLRMSPQERDLYKTLTKDAPLPTQEAVEAVLALGARSGKSLMTALMALYETICKADRWREHLRPGEIGYAVIVATRLAQAQDIIQGNAARICTENEALKELLACQPTQCRIEFKNGLTIMSLPANSTAGRGLPVYFLAADEIAHFYIDGPKADEAIYNSLSPRLAQFPGAKTTFGSTPAARQGLFYSWFNEGFNVEGRVTLQGPTTLMNPALDMNYLERIRRRDPDNYAREFEAIFAERMASYFSEESIAHTLLLVGDQEPVPGVHYHLGVDQSGLAGRDRFAAAVAHADHDGRVRVDAIRSWDTKDADEIMRGLRALAKTYGIAVALIDQYAAGWVATQLLDIGLTAERRPPLPAVYANTKSLMLAGRLLAPDDCELREGLRNTTAFYGRNNSLSIAHERTDSGHGDVADAVATAVWAASGEAEALQPAFAKSDIEAMADDGEYLEVA